MGFIGSAFTALPIVAKPRTYRMGSELVIQNLLMYDQSPAWQQGRCAYASDRD